MKNQFLVFLVRWALNSFGLWIAIRLLGTGYEDKEVTAGFWGFILAGLIFSLVNSIFKPLAVVLSLPLILLTLGLFVIVVNGILVYLAIAIAPGISLAANFPWRLSVQLCLRYPVHYWFHRWLAG